MILSMSDINLIPQSIRYPLIKTIFTNVLLFKIISTTPKYRCQLSLRVPLFIRPLQLETGEQFVSYLPSYLVSSLVSQLVSRREVRSCPTAHQSDRAIVRQILFISPKISYLFTSPTVEQSDSSLVLQKFQFRCPTAQLSDK